MTAEAALIAWVLNSVIGLVMLYRWLVRHRASPGPSSFPPPLVFFHLATASLGLGLWTTYLATGRPAALAWGAFVVINVNNGLGDTILTRGWRGRQAAAGKDPGSGSRAYGRAVIEILTLKRPVPSGHALLAGATFFLVLLAALGIGA